MLLSGTKAREREKEKESERPACIANSTLFFALSNFLRENEKKKTRPLKQLTLNALAAATRASSATERTASFLLIKREMKERDGGGQK